MHTKDIAVSSYISLWHNLGPYNIRFVGCIPPPNLNFIIAGCKHNADEWQHKLKHFTTNTVPLLISGFGLFTFVYHMTGVIYTLYNCEWTSNKHKWIQQM